MTAEGIIDNSAYRKERLTPPTRQELEALKLAIFNESNKIPESKSQGNRFDGDLPPPRAAAEALARTSGDDFGKLKNNIIKEPLELNKKNS